MRELTRRLVHEWEAVTAAIIEVGIRVIKYNSWRHVNSTAVTTIVIVNIVAVLLLLLLLLLF